jgi:Rrf2 family transcriptional regulator, iron-sulfur cluster assembly transcription factor
VINLNKQPDFAQVRPIKWSINLIELKQAQAMIFSKSFGYAVRGILYLALITEANKKIRVKEIATRLNIPPYFLGKIMKKLVKKGILDSTRGVNGGFSINEKTMSVSVLALARVIEDEPFFTRCILHFKECNKVNPCPMHNRIEQPKAIFIQKLSETTLGDMVSKPTPEFLTSISAA